jgi:hypothetical protein
VDRNIITEKDIRESAARDSAAEYSATQDSAAQDAADVRDQIRKFEKSSELIEPDSITAQLPAVLAAPSSRSPQQPYGAPVQPTGSSPSKSSAQPKPDTWNDRIVKFIPVEAVGMYLALDGLIRSGNSDPMSRRIMLAIALGVSLLFTVVYLKKIQKIRRQSQIAVSIVALIAWVFALGGCFQTFAFYSPWQGTAVLIVVTTFLGLFEIDG